MQEKTAEFTVDFMGVGAPRCGTSWISACLAEHPEICFSKEKETHFFDLPYNFKRGMEYYRSFFDHCDPQKKIGEFTPAYYLNEEIAKKIKHTFPDIKLLIMLRNPVERAISDAEYYSRRNGTKVDLNELLEKPTEHRIIHAGNYYRYLSEFLRHFTPHQIHVIFYEEMVDNPAEVIQAVYRFLKVDTSYQPACLTQKVNAAKNIAMHFPVLNRIVNKRKKIRKNVLGDYAIRFLKAIGVNWVVKRVLRWNRHVPARVESIVDVDTRTRGALAAYYSNDVRELERYFNKSLVDLWQM